MFLRKLRIYFFAGLVVLLPVWLTIFAVVWIFNYVDGLVGAPFDQWFGQSLPGVGLLISLLLVVMVGWLTTHLVGQQLIDVGDRLMMRIPMVKAIYAAVKQVIEAVFGHRDQPFSRVVLIEYPRVGVYSIAFASGDLPGTDLIRVWVLPGPSPTAGPILMIPQAEVISLPLTVEDGLKFIVSAGALLPKEEHVEEIALAVTELRRRRAGEESGGRPEVS